MAEASSAPAALPATLDNVLDRFDGPCTVEQPDEDVEAADLTSPPETGLPTWNDSVGGSGFSLPPLVDRVGAGKLYCFDAIGDDEGDCGLPAFEHGVEQKTSESFALPPRLSDVIEATVGIDGPKDGAEDGAEDVVGTDDDSEEELEVTTASLPKVECLYVGESVKCSIILNQQIPADQEDQINEYICFNWKRSIDQNNWSLASSGTAESHADTYIPTPDDLGYYIRCEAWFDEQRPVATESYLVGITEQTKGELQLAIQEGLRGFAVTASVCNPDVHDDEQMDALNDDHQQHRFRCHLVIQPMFVRAFDVDNNNTILVKAMYSEKCSLKLMSNSNNHNCVYLKLPTCKLQCFFPTHEVRNYFTLTFRSFQALATQDIGSEVFSSEAYNAWKEGTFTLADHTLVAVVEHRFTSNRFLNTLDKHMRQHYINKCGPDWLLARDTLLATLLDNAPTTNTTTTPNCDDNDTKPEN